MSETLLLNKNAILESMGGDDELFTDMARMYIEEHTNYCQNLNLALSENNPETLRREAHTLKSLLATFADEEGRQLAIAVEQRAKSGMVDIEGTKALSRRVQLLADLLAQEVNQA